MSSELERALGIVLRVPVSLTAAGRTDKGVHALGQVVSYDGPLPALRAINAVLPAEVAVLAAESVPNGFNARRDATSRSYLYRLLARPMPSPFERTRALWWPHAVDEGALQACAEALRGVHDFSAFTPSETYHHHFRREVHSAVWERNGPRGHVLEFSIEADSFLRHMNRVLVGTMLEVASGRRSAESFTELLTGRPRSEAGATAPPHGLYLAGVRYATG